MVYDWTKGEGNLEKIPVAQEFPNVFPEGLLGLLPEREVEFVIKLGLSI